MILLFLAAGCGDSSGERVADASVTDPADASVTDPGDASVTELADAGQAADAGGDEPAFAPDRPGLIALSEHVVTGGTQVELTARLWEYSEPFAMKLVAREGDCAVYRRSVAGFCDPACDGELCSPDNECVAFPSNRNAGTITVDGLLAPAAFHFQGSSYRLDSTLVDSSDLFESGATITVSAPGDETAGFSLAGTGVAPLVTEHVSVEIFDDADTEVTWVAEGQGRVQLRLQLGWHGAPATDMLLCETADDGQLTIPASLSLKMPYYQGGLFQVPSMISRFERAVHGEGAEAVELLISSISYVGFVHPPPQ